MFLAPQSIYTNSTVSLDNVGPSSAHSVLFQKSTSHFIVIFVISVFHINANIISYRIDEIRTQYTSKPYDHIEWWATMNQNKMLDKYQKHESFHIYCQLLDDNSR